MRQRLHMNNAEKQRAYRARHRHDGDAPLVAEDCGNPTAKGRQPARPARIQALEREAEDLADEYRVWREAIPPNLAGGPLAEQLDETIAQLDRVAGLLAEIEPPRVGRR